MGSDHPGTNKIGHRYGSNPATFLLNDYDKVLSLFFARNNKLVEQYHEKCRKAQSRNEPLPPPIKSLKEHAEEIWNFLLPKRQIDLSGNEVHVKLRDQRYHGKEMSDGERVILYMIVQVLSVKTNSLLIIDEPELHIHKAILDKLWDKLEEARQDCVFMYITHDLSFAVARNVNEVMWVQTYNGQDEWEFEFLSIADYSELPESLLFEIMGTQKRVIFVEGTKDSLDYLLFQELYKEKNYHVIPCGGCSQVINYVKAKKGYSKFDHLEVYGIIDRDYRTQHEIEALEKHGIFTLKVAEVENLFIVPELLRFIAERFGADDTVVNDVETFVAELYNKQVQKQVMAAFSSEINHRLKTLNIKEYYNTEKVKSMIDEKFSQENIDCIFNEINKVYSSIDNYKDILRVFNYKELSEKISPKFGLQKGKYRKIIINLLKRSGRKQEKEVIFNAIKSYVPELPKL